MKLRKRLLYELEIGLQPKVRLRENFKRHRIGDTGWVTKVDDMEFPPITVDIQGAPDYNGKYYFHYHDLELIEQPPASHSFVALPDKYCPRQNDLKRYKEGPASENPQACQSMCSKNPGNCSKRSSPRQFATTRLIALAATDCLSAEYYASEPLECQLSSTCDASAAISAQTDWRVTLFVKVANYDYD